jgi:hypothetical protein
MKVLAAGLVIALLAGCAGTGSPALRAGAPGVVISRGITAQSAKDAIVIGKSTKADVTAALGQPIAIPFDSGYEVWVYRWPGAEPTPRAATELVVLFAPSGVANKARIRPGYPPAR